MPNGITDTNYTLRVSYALPPTKWVSLDTMITSMRFPGDPITLSPDRSFPPASYFIMMLARNLASTTELIQSPAA